MAHFLVAINLSCGMPHTCPCPGWACCCPETARSLRSKGSSQLLPRSVVKADHPACHTPVLRHDATTLTGAHIRLTPMAVVATWRQSL